MIKITQEVLNKGLSKKGGYSDKQIKVLGDSLYTKGWRARLLKKFISQESLDEFISLKNEHLSKELKKTSSDEKGSYILKNYEKFNSESQVRRWMCEEYKYGREANASILLYKLIKENKHLKIQNEELLDKTENCYCVDNSVEESYEQFLDKIR